MERFSRYVLGHRRAVRTVLVLLFVASGGAIALLIPNMTEANQYPGLPAYEANQQIVDTYGTGGYERPFVPVVTLADGAHVDDPGVRDALGDAFAAAGAAAEARVVSWADTGDPVFVGDDGRTTFGLVLGGPVERGGLPGSALGEGGQLTDLIVDAMTPALPAGATLQVTGLDPLATGADAGGLNVPVKLAITVLAALVVLAWAFRSLLALVPLLTAFVAVPISYIGLLAVSPFVTVHETTVIMLPLLGIGIAIDYALLVVARWREERARGTVGDEAVHAAMRTAGHAVAFSSGAVAIGLLTMIVLPVPLLRSLGIGGTIVTATSALVSITMLPLVLSWVGRRTHGASVRPSRLDRDGSRQWTRWAEGVVRLRWPAAAAATAVMLALGAVAVNLNLDVPASDDLAASGLGRDGLDTLRDAGLPSGVVASFDVYVPPGTDPDALADDLRALPGVHGVAAPDADAWRTDGSAVLTVLPVEESATAGGRATIDAVVAQVPPGAMVGGNATQQIGYVQITYGTFVWMLVLVALVSYVMLARAFRSLLLPLKAIVMNLMSFAAVLGAMVLVWQWGWGTQAVLGIQPDGAIGTFVPVTLFAFLFGLTMDYEVFILSRVREEYDRTGDTRAAVVRGVARTGRLVTYAALILFFSFASMASGGELDVAIFASGIALGILLDATVVRSVLVPATVVMMGRWNWWLPVWAARVLRVEPSPLAPRATATTSGPVAERVSSPPRAR
ncbi:MMPL family transporter [Cellulomonas sp. zg-ZUI22]|uniref:MMPL family transporter n=1 Tax=Cellulomonas sp. zg-ZUI22 TaxID=2816955 RepID=UPI001A93C2B4|nr:MMPL family transporter [Cellulomonas sp. zg-ZUI22]MBO0898892.1 MMPL family transporter [Cellulomonas sp. zg-ZUI22]